MFFYYIHTDIMNIHMNKVYEELFREHSTSIYRYILLRVGSKEVAQDIMSETFKKLLEKKDLKPELAKHWLFTVARNTMYKKFKDDKNAGQQALDEMIEESELAADDQGDYDQNLVDDELIAKLEIYLDQISPKSREVISLKIWEEMQFNEIADILSEKESTVKLRYYRGLEKLKDLVTKDYQKHQITIPLIIGGFLMLGTKPAYAASNTLISNIISTTYTNMSVTATGSAAAQTGAAATATTKAGSPIAAFLAGIKGTQGALLAAAGSTVVVGTAAVLAISSGTFSSNNAATGVNPGSSYPSSYGTSYPTSYPPSYMEGYDPIGLDPQREYKTYRSFDPTYSWAKFKITAPTDWKLERKYSDDLESATMVFTRENQVIMIARTVADGVPCGLESQTNSDYGILYSFTNPGTIYTKDGIELKYGTKRNTKYYSVYGEDGYYEGTSKERSLPKTEVEGQRQNVWVCTGDGEYLDGFGGTFISPLGVITIANGVKNYELDSDVRQILESIQIVEAQIPYEGQPASYASSSTYTTNKLSANNPLDGEIEIELPIGWYVSGETQTAQGNSVFIEKNERGMRLFINQSTSLDAGKCVFSKKGYLDTSGRLFYISEYDSVYSPWYKGLEYRIAKNANVQEYVKQENGQYEWEEFFNISGDNSSDFACTKYPEDTGNEWVTNHYFGQFYLQYGPDSTEEERQTIYEIISSMYSRKTKYETYGTKVD